MRFIRFVKKLLFLLLLSLLCSCATMDSLTRTRPEPTVYYAGVEDLKLFSAPRFSEEPIAALKKNEKLLRYRVEKGFAYVKVVKTGQEGWVENARLIWKKEASEKSVEKNSAPAENAGTNPDESHPEKLGSRGASIFDAF